MMRSMRAILSSTLVLEYVSKDWRAAATALSTSPALPPSGDGRERGFDKRIDKHLLTGIRRLYPATVDIVFSIVVHSHFSTPDALSEAVGVATVAGDSLAGNKSCGRRGQEHREADKIRRHYRPWYALQVDVPLTNFGGEARDALRHFSRHRARANAVDGNPVRTEFAGQASSSCRSGPIWKSHNEGSFSFRDGPRPTRY